jgi:arylsulfatase A-like enzyme
MYALIALCLRDYLNGNTLRGIFAFACVFVGLFLQFQLRKNEAILISTNQAALFSKKSSGRKWERLTIPIKITALSLLLLVFSINVYLVTREIYARQGPNIIILVIDCLRKDHVSCYGYNRETTPTIDSLAQTGWVFEQAYTNAAWTKPAIASVFTSLYPNIHGVVNPKNSLPDGLLTMAEMLKNAGYTTHFFNGGNSFIRKEFNFHQGFDTYHYRSLRSKTAVDITDDFLKQITNAPKAKFFAYLHYMDAHAPYNKNEYNSYFTKNKNEYFQPGSDSSKVKTIRSLTQTNTLAQEDKQYLIALYDGQIRFIDTNIKRIIAYLQQENLFKDTLFIITADHGEEFWEHSNFEHGHTLYNELIHIPLIIAGANTKQANIQTPVSLIDLLPTVIEAAGVSADTSTLQGRSLLHLIAQAEDAAQVPIFATGTYYGDEKYCLIKDNQKVILNTGNTEKKFSLIGSSSEVEFELYDLSKDPAEKDNQIDDRPAIASQLKNILRQFKDQRSPYQQIESAIIIDDSLQEQLRALGYLE